MSQGNMWQIHWVVAFTRWLGSTGCGARGHALRGRLRIFWKGSKDSVLGAELIVHVTRPRPPQGDNEDRGQVGTRCREGDTGIGVTGRGMGRVSHCGQDRFWSQLVGEAVWGLQGPSAFACPRFCVLQAEDTAQPCPPEVARAPSPADPRAPCHRVGVTPQVTVGPAGSVLWAVGAFPPRGCPKLPRHAPGDTASSVTSRQTQDQQPAGPPHRGRSSATGCLAGPMCCRGRAIRTPRPPNPVLPDALRGRLCGTPARGEGAQASEPCADAWAQP